MIFNHCKRIQDLRNKIRKSLIGTINPYGYRSIIFKWYSKHIRTETRMIFILFCFFLALTYLIIKNKIWRQEWIKKCKSYYYKKNQHFILKTSCLLIVSWVFLKTKQNPEFLDWIYKEQHCKVKTILFTKTLRNI